MRSHLLALVVAVSAPSTALADGGVGNARLHFERGSALYRDGRYAEAAAEFEAARASSALPAIDYDVARAYDRMGRAREAIEAYGRFLAEAPADPDAADVRARVEVLRQQVATPAPAPAPAVALPPPPTPAVALPAAPASVDPPPRRHVYPWVVGGAGAALLVGSLASGLFAHARYEDLASRCAPDGVCDPVKVPGAQALIDGGRSAGIASDVLLGAGAATVAAGLVLYLVDGRHREKDHRAWIAPDVGVYGGGITMGGAW